MGIKQSKVAAYRMIVLNPREDTSADTVINTSFEERIKSKPNNRETIKPVKVRPQTGKKRETMAVVQRAESAGGQGLLRPMSANQLAERNEDSLFGIECSTQYPWLMKKANLTRMPLKLMDMGAVIGQGFMGTVRLCKTRKGQYFVLKSVNKDFIVKQHSERHINNERHILSALTSPFCVRSFGCLADKQNIYMAMEYVPGGELDRLLQSRGPFNSDEAKFYMTEIFCGLEHVHTLGYVYRDLKPENVAIDEAGHIKLLDFGFATPYSSSTRLHTNCGTPAYLSPEQLDGKLTNGYTGVIDWWAFGVVLFELLTGKTPFSSKRDDTAYEIFLRILQQKISYPRKMDPSAKALISQLCASNMEQRLCATEEIKKHSYFTVPWTAVLEKRLVPPFVPHLNDAGDWHYFDRK